MAEGRLPHILGTFTAQSAVVKDVLMRVDESPFIDFIDVDGKQVKTCNEVMKCRFPASYQAGVFKKHGLTFQGYLIVKNYAYHDTVICGEETTIIDLLGVYHWALMVHAPDRFVKLVLNVIIDKVEGSNCLSVFHYCDKINTPEFVKLRDHCLGLMWVESTSGRLQKVTGIMDEPMTLILVMSQRMDLLEKSHDLPSDYVEDLSRLFDSDQATIKMVLSKEKCVGIVPAILTSASDYFKSLLSFDMKDGSVEFLVDLSRDEYEQLSDEDKKTREIALYKILEYSHTGTTDVTEHTYTIWYFTCYIGLDELKRNCEREIIKSFNLDNVVNMAKLLPVDDMNNHNLRIATINHLYTNWQKIKALYSPGELMNCLSQELMLELLMKL
jgi:hypothetical protein